ncbi:condensin-2 complex subunit G2-like isoform X2 [Schistocerca gregaria]|uniref:condensin-2 complex subunit G2-like isoform X2 n=1 Tax=Schistocerca gregaria TaxID=7010 RepID=UPI00211E22DA|nr:condensin-2 complex subunit G2-like isoform X2 [Schistocerca gregaria]
MPLTRKRKASKKFSEQYYTILESQKHPVIPNELLQKVKEDGIANLTREESHVFWRSLHDNSVAHLQILFPDEVEACTQDRETSVEFLDVVFFLLHQLLEEREPNVENFSSQIFIVLVGLLKNDCLDDKIKQKIVKLSEEWCRRKLLLYNSAIVVTFEYLFEVSLKKGATKADVRRACGLRSAVKLESNIAKNRQLFLDAMRNINYLTTKEGCKFLALVLTMDDELTKDMHGVCKGFLLECNRNIAKAYGDIYYTAWSVADTAMRKFIEEYLIQDFMARIMDLKRQVLEMSQLGQKVLTILHAFHTHKSNTQVRSMLATLYEPILWRNLKSPNSTVRSNAAEVFLDAYPLERCGEGRDKNVAFAERQHKIMTELLTDKWHVVRIIAVRHICQIASDFWQVIPPEVIQQWLTIVITQLAWDSSSAEVRRSVYRGMRALVVNPLCAEYMQKVLPHMQDGIHDTNARVRTAFVEMLVACKDASSIKFWLIVPLNHLLARLEVDEQAVAQRIVKLLFESFYPYERGPEVTLKRIMNMIVLSPIGSRKFFFYSKSVLSFESSVQLVLSIMTYILRYVKSEFSGKLTVSNGTEQDKPTVTPKTSKDNKEAPASKKRRISSPDPVSSLETSGPLNTEAADGETELYFKTSLENPLVTEIFIDIVSTLLTIHDHRKQEAEYKEQWQKMYTMCKMCIPDFLRYFKGTRTYDSVLYLCSLMPQSVRKSIRPVFHLDSTCLSQLKALSVDSSDEEVLKLVSLLCSWNRGDELLEMAKNWIDEALRAEDLNSTRYGEPKAERRKVKIKDAREPNPLLGFRVLNAIFCYPPNNAKILAKHYNLIVEIWNYLERVKKLIETRMEHSSAFDSCLLSDEFIIECFSRYLKLIPYLKIGSEGHKFDSESAFTTVLDWSEKILVSSLPKEFPLTNDDTAVEWVIIDSVGPLLVSLLNEVLKVGANMILLGQASVKLTSKVIRLCKLLLRTGCRVMFVYSACGVMHHISDYYKKILSGKNLSMLFNTVANLLGDCVSSLTDLAFTKEGLKLHIENFAETRTAMINTLMLLSKMFGVSNDLFVKTFNKFVTAILVIMKKDAGLLENIAILKKVQDLPYVASQLVTSFYNNKILTEMMFQALERNISREYQEDSSKLLAALGLLLLFVRYRRYVSVESLKSALNSAESAVVSYHAQISKEADMETDDTILEKMMDVLKEARTELTNPQKEAEQDAEPTDLQMEEQDVEQPERVKQKKRARPDNPVHKNNNQSPVDVNKTSSRGRKLRTAKRRGLKKLVDVVKLTSSEVTNPQKKAKPRNIQMEDEQKVKLLDNAKQSECETSASSVNKTPEDANETSSSGRKLSARKRRVFEKTVEVTKETHKEMTNARKQVEQDAEPTSIRMEEEEEVEPTDSTKQKEFETPEPPVNINNNQSPEDENKTGSVGRKLKNRKRRVLKKTVEVIKQTSTETTDPRKKEAEPRNRQVEDKVQGEPQDSVEQKECEISDPPVSKTPDDTNETSSSRRKSSSRKRRVFEETVEGLKEKEMTNAQKEVEQAAEPTNIQMEEEEIESPDECETPKASANKTPGDANRTSSNERKSSTRKRRVLKKTVEVIKQTSTETTDPRKKEAEPRNRQVEDKVQGEPQDSVEQKECEISDPPVSKTPDDTNETSSSRRKSSSRKRRVFEETVEGLKEKEMTNAQKEVEQAAEPTNIQMEEGEIESPDECETPKASANKTPGDANRTSSNERKSSTRKRRVLKKKVEVIKQTITDITNPRKEAEPGKRQTEDEQEVEPPDSVKQNECETPNPPVSKTPEDANGTSHSGRKSSTRKRRVFEKTVDVLKEAHTEMKKAQKEAEPTNIQMEEEQEVDPPDGAKRKACETQKQPVNKNNNRNPEDANKMRRSQRKSRTYNRP